MEFEKWWAERFEKDFKASPSMQYAEVAFKEIALQAWNAGASSGMISSGTPEWKIQRIVNDFMVSREEVVNTIREIQPFMNSRRYIDAIKQVRHVLNLSLKNAKDFVDFLKG